MTTRRCNKPECTNLLNEHDKFCGACGTPANLNFTLLPTVQQTAFCGHCGTSLGPDTNFCSRCGRVTTLTASENTAIVCMSCGHPRNQFQTTCPICNSIAPTMPAFGVPFVSTVPSQVVAPPLRIEHPTEQDIHHALTAKNNPYLPSGTLKSLENYSDGDLRPLVVKRDRLYADYWDFDSSASNSIIDGTIQGHFRLMTVNPSDEVSAGLLFRVMEQGKNNKGKKCIGYLFSLECRSMRIWKYQLRVIQQNVFGGSVIAEGELPQMIDIQAPFLLAVSMQRNVFDLYLNLQHLHRTYDNTFISGKTGVFLSAFNMRQYQCELIVSHYKIWEK